MSKSNQAVKSVAIIIFFSLASKLLGFIREALIAAKFGSGSQTDTYFIAITAITLFTSMITKSINTTMIPVLSEVEAKEGKKGKRYHTNNFLNIIIILSFITIIIAWLLAPFIIRILATGFKGKQFSLAVQMMRIGMPAIIFASIQGVLRGYLQSELLFTESAAAQFPFNFVYIVFLLLLSSKYGIKGLMVTSVIAVASQIILQVPGIRSLGFKYSLLLDLKDKYVKRIANLTPPVLISATITDINNLIDNTMASMLVVGSISALQYGHRLNTLIRGTFILAITTVIFPMLSKEANKEGLNDFKKVIVKGMNIIFLITIPATVGMIVLAEPIVRIAFQRGVFDATATYMTVGALIFYSIGLIGSSIRSLLYRAFYSLQDSKTPMVNSIIALGINIVLNFALIRTMGHKGLALATSISAIFSAGFLVIILRKKIGTFDTSRTIKCAVKSIIASFIMGFIVYYLYGILTFTNIGEGFGEIISLLISISIGGLVYFILIYLFKIEEINWVIGLIKERFRKE